MSVNILTGIRPTGNLTIANYLGAVQPIIELQQQNEIPVVFVADLHSLTDREPEQVKKYVREVVADYLALGVDPDKANIYLQSFVTNEVATLMMLLSRHISVGELLHIPTLKDKLTSNTTPEMANVMLMMYPVLMAADILLNRAQNIPVGDDQVLHIEVTRKLARRFNKKYGEVFPIPNVLQQESLRILSLRGNGKMSKTNPEGAIFLTDNPDTVERKIKSAQTACEGEVSPALENCIFIAKGLVNTDKEREMIDEIIGRHLCGEAVMGQFKTEFAKIVKSFLREFQERRTAIISRDGYIQSILMEGSVVARDNAQRTISLVKKYMGL